MAKKANPFEFDFSAFSADFDPAKMTAEFTKIAEKLKAGPVDMTAIMDSQRKNVEALTAANKTAVEGMQAVAKRQAELLSQAVEAASGAVESMTSAGTPQEAAAKQADLVKATFEKTLADMTEIAEMSAKANTAASAAINKRISESLEEMKKLVLSYK